jgi:hypothetical protein
LGTIVAIGPSFSKTTARGGSTNASCRLSRAASTIQTHYRVALEDSRLVVKLRSCRGWRRNNAYSILQSSSDFQARQESLCLRAGASSASAALVFKEDTIEDRTTKGITGLVSSRCRWYHDASFARGFPSAAPGSNALITTRQRSRVHRAAAGLRYDGWLLDESQMRMIVVGPSYVQ